MRKRIWIVPACLLAIPPSPLAAQGLDLDIRPEQTEAASEQVAAEEAIQRSQVVYGPPPPRASCRQDSDGGEIVVCAEEEEDQSEFRVQSTAELDPESREATDDGVPRAPDVAGEGIFKGDGQVKFGSVPEPVIMFDISELPEAPEGSDADLIAKGKKKFD